MTVKLSAAQLKILRAIDGLGQAYTRQIEQKTGLNPRLVISARDALYFKELIEKCDAPDGAISGGPARQYLRLTDAGRSAIV